MKCQKCKKNLATIHLTEIIQGKRSETHLCQSCAEIEGIAVKSQIPINELLSSLLCAEQTDSKPSENLKCDFCDMTWDDFRKNSMLGCPNDYDVFSKPLEEILNNVHRGNDKIHTGKIPTKADQTATKQAQLIRLKKSLSQALSTEDYETAASLRDEIKQLGFDI